MIFLFRDYNKLCIFVLRFQRIRATKLVWCTYRGSRGTDVRESGALLHAVSYSPSLPRQADNDAGPGQG